MTFHLSCVHIIFSSVKVAECCEIAANSVDHSFSLYFLAIFNININYFLQLMSHNKEKH